MTTEDHSAAVRRIVDDAPPLTDDQLRQLAALRVPFGVDRAPDADSR